MQACSASERAWYSSSQRVSGPALARTPSKSPASGPAVASDAAVVSTGEGAGSGVTRDRGGIVASTGAGSVGVSTAASTEGAGEGAGSVVGSGSCVVTPVAGASPVPSPEEDGALPAGAAPSGDGSESQAASNPAANRQSSPTHITRYTVFFSPGNIG